MTLACLWNYNSTAQCFSTIRFRFIGFEENERNGNQKEMISRTDLALRRGVDSAQDEVGVRQPAEQHPTDVIRLLLSRIILSALSTTQPSTINPQPSVLIHNSCSTESIFFIRREACSVITTDR